MPIGYDYRCDTCAHDWMLFSTRLILGPTQWEHVRYTCFSCQTFLSVAKSVDRNSWAVWLRNNRESVDSNAAICQLARDVDHRLATVNRLTPIDLAFESITCPTCQNDQMLDIPFGQHPMRCPKCHQFTGRFVNEGCISIYGEIDPNDEIGE